MRVLISGGSIAGLSLALIAKKAGYLPIIVEKKSLFEMTQSNIGGGIGLWPPALQVIKKLNIYDYLRSQGRFLPQASYYSSNGQLLGIGTSAFNKKFQVLCLQRDILIKALYDETKKQKITISSENSIKNISETQGHLTAICESGDNIKCDLVVGCDGINSKVRDIMSEKLNIPKLQPKHCKYTYYRAVINLGLDIPKEYYQHSFECWGDGMRFGYVPLDKKKVFWFVAIPLGTTINDKRKLQQMAGSRQCDEETKDWILKIFQTWKSPIDIKFLIESTPCQNILRTDIRKIEGVTDWHYQGKIFILGDAANATAPNLAQGAGLALESAWDFISMIDFEGTNKRKDVDEFVNKRKKRAKVVQNLADTIAWAGQLSGRAYILRNFVMRSSTWLFPSLQKLIFESVVKYSLGGTANSLTWTPINSIFQKDLLIQKVVGEQNFSRLPTQTKAFRGYCFGEGVGSVSVRSNSLGRIFGLPKDMKDLKFGAYIDTYKNPNSNTYYEKWTRVFGQEEPSAIKYETYHEVFCDLGSQRGYTLTESLGFFGRLMKLGYNIEIQQDQIGHLIVKYTSNSFWIGTFKIPLGKYLFPTSEWIEKQIRHGWHFDGCIRFPRFLGHFSLMKYYGDFYPKIHCQTKEKKTVTIAGGTGLIGSNMVKQFYKEGWNVQLLTRNKKKHENKFHFTTLCDWDPSRHSENQEIAKIVSFIASSHLIVNLAGENPGTVKWDENGKNKILESRLNSIKILSNALQYLKKDIPVIQASAVGIYGHRGDDILTDEADYSNEKMFRMDSLKSIEKIAKQKFRNLVITRIGHVLSCQGTLYQALKLAARMGTKSFGRGGQYLPWIHIQDVGQVFVFIGQNIESVRKQSPNQIVNLAAQQSQTYDEVLKNIRNTLFFNFPGVIPIPERILTAILGQISCVLLQSQRISPSTLLNCGYKFKYPHFQAACSSRDLL